MELAQTSRRRSVFGATLALGTACSVLAGLPASAAPASGPLARVVVTGSGLVADVARAVRAAGGRVVDELPLVGGVSADVPRGALLAPRLHTFADRTLTVSGLGHDDGVTPATLRDTLGLGPGPGEDRRGHGHRQGDANGAGVTVAVVDTGVADVADLAGRVTHVDVTGTATRSQRDGYGHGTFVAGLIAGDGASSDGAYQGVAPRARILDVRVADAQGTTDLVSVLRGLQVVAAHPEVNVVNLSLSSDSPLPYELDPLTVALESLWRTGVTVVVPAGNDGPGAGTISSPGSDPVLLTAGALDESGTASRADDVVASWSSVGPAPQGVAKPDLVAPGAHLVSLRAPGSAVDVTHPLSRVGRHYFRGSGTSFATAVTSGAVAALLGRRDNDALAPDQVKDILTGSTYQGDGLSTPSAAGAGGLDLGAALHTSWSSVAHLANSAETPIPGDPATWTAFVVALMNGDEAAAASSWSALSPEARNWAASSWSALSPDARNWAASSWSARNWAGPDGSADEWLARNWAARNWAARNWAASSWSASSWSARNWAASSWSASSWSARNWSASSWSANGSWLGDDWSASSWSASSWSASSWSARNWSASSWSTTDWV